MLFRSAVRYRVHYAVLAGLLALFPFQYANAGFNDPAQYGAIAIAMLAMAAILYNKAADIAEDSLNARCLPLNPAKRRAALIVGSVFFVLPLPWIAFTSLNFLGAYLGLGAFTYLFSFGIGRVRLKKIFLVKNIAVAASFALMTLTPYYFLASDYNPLFFWQELGGTFMLMLCTDLLGDIRDANGDVKSGIRTPANTIGEIPTKVLCLGAIIGYAASWAKLYRPEALQIMSYCMLAAIVVLATRKRHYLVFQIIPIIWILIATTAIIKSIF